MNKQPDELEQMLSRVFELGMRTADVMRKEHGLPDKEAMLIEPKAAIEAYTAQAVAEARLDEVEHSLHKGYFIPEMEVYAEDRIAQLTPPNTQDQGEKEA